MTTAIPAQRFQNAVGARAAISIAGTPTRAYRPWRAAWVKKSPPSTRDSIAEDDSTITSPKTTRNSVVPSRRKYSGVSASNSLRTATTTVRGGVGSGGGRRAATLGGGRAAG